jgi:hypothetical protein
MRRVSEKQEAIPIRVKSRVRGAGVWKITAQALVMPGAK